MRLWDLRTGDPALEPLTGRSLTAYSVNFIRLERNLVVSGVSDGLLCFWDLTSGKPAGPDLEPFPSAVTQLGVADLSGVPILIAGDGYGLLRIWDTRAAGWTAELDVGGGITGLAVSDTGHICVATATGAVVLGINIADIPESRGDFP